MKKFGFIVTLMLLLPAAHADWFVRGTHNAWGTTPMAASGTNTVIARGVVFSTAGSYKIDRFGDWSENYGAGGVRNGSNISIGAGTWDISFNTSTKIASATSATSVMYLRGTHNAWAETTTMSATSTANVYLSCVQFTGGDANGGPRFKVDPNGGWGSDARPSTGDYAVSVGWVEITFNSATGVITTRENLGTNCSSAPSGTFHLRGTQNGWAEGDFFTRIGTSNQYEICRNFSRGDDSGAPRFKVDPNGAWGSDTFPAADENAGGWTKITIDGNARTVLSVNKNLGLNCTTAPVADDFRSRTIYFAFIDRFHNGNTGNDNGNNAAATSTSKLAGGIAEWKKYWGGDIQGLIDKLDYLQHLGIGAIWLTPMVDNIDAGSEGAYHGYWARDFYSVDEHLGNWALVDQLDAAMEARGMKLIIDMALNHSNDKKKGEFGELRKEGLFITNWASGRGSWYHDVGDITDCNDNNPATVCDGEWDDPWSFRNKALFDLADFNHGVSSNSLADRHLINAAAKWMEHGADAIRIDAIKHIEPSFINRFTSEIRQIKPDAYIVGEWYDAGAGHSQSMTFLNERRGSELLDFQLRNNIEKAIAGDITMTSLSAHIASRASTMNNFEDWQSIFLDNHDATRTSVYLQTTQKTNRGNGKGMSQSLANARQNMGMALVMTLPGIPTVYYGTEQNSTWFTANGEGAMGHDPYNREFMPSFSETSSAFQLISTLANLRKVSAAVQRGSYAERWVNSDVLVFQRQEGSDCVVVAVNRGAETSVSVPNLCKANGSYTSLIGSDNVSVSSGTATFNLSSNEVVVIR